MSVGHGMQDAAKTMGIIVLALYTGGFQDSPTHIPRVGRSGPPRRCWPLGTYAGGWRIIRTLGRQIIDLGPPEGFAAETVASSVLYFNALVLGAPISTTHTITSAIMGVGRDEAALRGPLGRRRQHRRRLDPHLPGAPARSPRSSTSSSARSSAEAGLVQPAAAPGAAG